MNLNKQLQMTTREIAKLTGKLHKNVMRDVEWMINRLNFELVDYLDSYVDSKGEKRKQYKLTKDLTLTLISGYDTKLRHTIVKRWQELEREVNGESLSNYYH